MNDKDINIVNSIAWVFALLDYFVLWFARELLHTNLFLSILFSILFLLMQHISLIISKKVIKRVDNPKVKWYTLIKVEGLPKISQE